MTAGGHVLAAASTPAVFILGAPSGGMAATTDPRAHHVGLTVADLDRAVAFYRSLFDCEVLARFAVAGEAFETGVGIEDASARFVHLDLGSVRLELVSYDPAGDPRAAPTLNRPGTTHVGVEVDDVDAFYGSLPDDVETVSPPQRTETGTTICFLRDPEANLVEVLEL